MAIDPNVLRIQRDTALDPESRRPVEYSCPRCGRRTRDRSGACNQCKASHVPRFDQLTTEAIKGVIAAARAELQRRKDEIDNALGGKP